jgi:hypothetical protein
MLPVFCAAAGRTTSIIAPANSVRINIRDLPEIILRSAVLQSIGLGDLMLFMPYSTFLDQ